MKYHARTGRYYFDAALDDTTTEAIAWLPRSKTISVILEPIGVASGYVQYTASHPDKIIAGTARWHTWEIGTVDLMTSYLAEGPLTALKAVRVTGDLIFEAQAI